MPRQKSISNQSYKQVRHPEGVDQAQAVRVVGNAQIPAALVFFDGVRADDYDHSTAYVETYTYDLYESTNTRYGQIMGYGTVVNDIPESDELVYTIDLKSTFDEVQGGGSQ